MMKPLVILIFIIASSPLTASAWTLFFYMAADNGLHSSAIDDIIEMQKGLYNSTIITPTIIVYIDHIPSYKNGSVEYLKITPSSVNTVTSQILKATPDENSGSGDTLLRFLQYVYPRYASNHNILSIWSHSNGWMRGDTHRWIGNDDTANDSIGISNSELHNALKRHNKKYDIIMLDACNAGSIEIYSEIQDFARYILASPDLFPSSGYPWTQILENWSDANNPLYIAQHFGENLLDAYSMGGVYNPTGTVDNAVSVSISDMQYYPDLIENIKNFTRTFALPNAQYATLFTSIRENTQLVYNPRESDIDLLQFVNDVLQHDTRNSVFTIPQRDILQNLQHSINLFIPEKYTLYSQYNTLPQSISIWYPLSVEQFYPIYISDFHSLRFASSSWGYFLNYAYGPDINPPSPVTNIHTQINLETLYIDWQPIIDPTPIKYSIFLNGVTHYDTLTTFKTKVSESGFFIIYATDEVGNISESSKQPFHHSPPTTNHFFVAPNPVRDTSQGFLLKYYLTKPSEFVNLSVYDMSGNMVYNVLKRTYIEDDEVQEETVIIPLQSGLYFAVLRTDSDFLTCKFSVIK